MGGTTVAVGRLQDAPLRVHARAAAGLGAGAEELAPQTRALLHQALEARLTLPTDPPSLQRPVLRRRSRPSAAAAARESTSAATQAAQTAAANRAAQDVANGRPGPGTTPATPRGTPRARRAAAEARSTGGDGASHGNPTADLRPRRREALGALSPDAGCRAADSARAASTHAPRPPDGAAAGRARASPGGARAAARGGAGDPPPSESHLVAGAEAFRAEAYAHGAGRVPRRRVARVGRGLLVRRGHAAEARAGRGRGGGFRPRRAKHPAPRATLCSTITAGRPATRHGSTSARTAGSSPPSARAGPRVAPQLRALREAIRDALQPDRIAPAIDALPGPGHRAGRNPPGAGLRLRRGGRGPRRPDSRHSTAQGEATSPRPAARGVRRRGRPVTRRRSSSCSPRPDP